MRITFRYSLIYFANDVHSTFGVRNALKADLDSSL